MTVSRIVSFNEKLIVALDVDTMGQTMDLVNQLQPLGVTFKVGMQLFYQGGMALIHALQAKGCSIFLDLKLHDIPNTVAKATEGLVSQGVTFLNVHTQGGSEMMRAAAEAGRKAAEAKDLPEPLIIGVTLLTSLSQERLSQELKVGETTQDYVVHLASLAQESGLQGVVCSAQEAPSLRKACGSGFVLVTPGIRPAGAATHDQSRVLTPGEALRAGSDFLVVGRPITHAENPAKAAEGILEEMSAALSRRQG
jgi:orotidine-5'-phosphate decarboxylase